MPIHQLEQRARKMIQTLRALCVRQQVNIGNIHACIRGGEERFPFPNGGEWGADAAHEWMDFAFSVTVPQGFRHRPVLRVTTGREGMWEAVNPQFVAWVDGRIEQAFDTQHHTLVLAEQSAGQTWEVLLQGYANFSAADHGKSTDIPPRLYVALQDVCADVEQLVYDLDVIYQAMMLEHEGCRSREQAARTLSDALNLLDLRDPHSGAFHASVAAARAYLRVNYYEPLAAAEPEGGMWVEADCNVTGGESLVRQLLYGNEYFIKEFGRRSTILWLPDVFGYSAALPQILKKSGIDYFFTSKLSWSEYNCSPYDTFRWKGIDGSEVLTHFTPARDYANEEHGDLAYFTTYNAMINASQLKGGWQRFQQKGLDNHFLVSYGYGDGGGGPTDWMVENARRMQHSVQGLPAVKQVFPSEFFRSLEKRVGGDKRLPKWSGELYLEYHRGTYTAMARNKRCNRLMERELRETELWRTAALHRAGLPYPQEELRSIWRRMLTLQFHDILPGSSIKKVYDDSAEIYAQLFAETAALKQAAFAALDGGAGDLVLMQSLAHTRDDIVWFDAPADVTALRDAAGNEYPVQHVEGRACAYVKNLTAMGGTPVWFVRGQQAGAAVTVTDKTFDTPFFSGTFDKAMRIVSLVDKRAGRELVKPGQALNRIVCYENRPHNYDAWDINIYYDERQWDVDDLVSAQVISAGPVMTRLRCQWRFNRSTIVQDMVFYADIDRIDFETMVDWQEQHYMLKAHFPVDIFYNEATYDIQFGNVKRPTHRNTSWDAARFEVCAHKWMDVSEGNYGFALLNDCKYGHSADENGIALTLLKSSTDPNPVADQETHVFTYAIMPHSGDWRRANVPDMAIRLNTPVTAIKGAAVPTFASVDGEGVILETVKQALNGEGTILRLYECFGQRAHAKLHLGFDARSACVASLMEDEGEPVALCDGEVHLELKPYEICTLIVR